jgi:hypothetical protein
VERGSSLSEQTRRQTSNINAPQIQPQIQQKATPAKDYFLKRVWRALKFQTGHITGAATTANWRDEVAVFNSGGCNKLVIYFDKYKLPRTAAAATP